MDNSTRPRLPGTGLDSSLATLCCCRFRSHATTGLRASERALVALPGQRRVGWSSRNGNKLVMGAAQHNSTTGTSKVRFRLIIIVVVAFNINLFKYLINTLGV